VSSGCARAARAHGWRPRPPHGAQTRDGRAPCTLVLALVTRARGTRCHKVGYGVSKTNVSRACAKLRSCCCVTHILTEVMPSRKATAAASAVTTASSAAPDRHDDDDVTVPAPGGGGEQHGSGAHAGGAALDLETQRGALEAQVAQQLGLEGLPSELTVMLKARRANTGFKKQGVAVCGMQRLGPEAFLPGPSQGATHKLIGACFYCVRHAGRGTTEAPRGQEQWSAGWGEQRVPPTSTPVPPKPTSAPPPPPPPNPLCAPEPPTHPPQPSSPPTWTLAEPIRVSCAQAEPLTHPRRSRTSTRRTPAIGRPTST